MCFSKPFLIDRTKSTTMIRNTNTSNNTANLKETATTEAPSRVTSSRTGPLVDAIVQQQPKTNGCHAVGADGSLPNGADLEDSSSSSTDENDHPFLEDPHVDTSGTPALHRVLTDLRLCLDDTRPRQTQQVGGGRYRATDDVHRKQSDHFAAVQCDEVTAVVPPAPSRHDRERIRLAECWNALGLVRIHMQQDVKEAKKCHQRALQIYKSTDCYSQQQRNFTGSGKHRHDGAKADSCKPDGGKMRGKEEESTVMLAVAITLKDIGLCYERLNQHEKSLSRYQECLNIFRSQDLSKEHTQVVATLRSISRLSPQRLE